MEVNYDNLANFLFETEKLKLTERSGWTLAGIKNPETVADHSCCAAYVAFVLAKLEGVDPFKAAAIAAMHELPETRLSDLNAVSSKYVSNKKEIEKQIVQEQLELLPEEFRMDMNDVLNHGSDNNDIQIVVKDADLIEMLIQAKRYQEQGNDHVQHWIDNVKKNVKTESAKKLIESIENTDSYQWAKNLKNVKR